MLLVQVEGIGDVGVRARLDAHSVGDHAEELAKIEYIIRNSPPQIVTAKNDRQIEYPILHQEEKHSGHFGSMGCFAKLYAVGSPYTYCPCPRYRRRR